MIQFLFFYFIIGAGWCFLVTNSMKKEKVMRNTIWSNLLVWPIPMLFVGYEFILWFTRGK